MYFWWQDFKDKYSKHKIGYSFAIVLVITLFTALIMVNNYNRAQRDEQFRIEQKKRKEAEDYKNKFYKLHGRKYNDDKKEVTDAQVKHNLEELTKDKEAIKFDDGFYTKMIKPSEDTLQILSQKSIDWNNLYLKRGEFNYIVVKTLNFGATGIKTKSGVIMVSMPNNYTKDQLRKVADSIFPILKLIYRSSSFSMDSSNFTLHLTTDSGLDYKKATFGN